MACGTNEYFVGQGPVYIRSIADDCGSAEEGWWNVGDANEMSINTSQEFGDHMESQSGNRVRSARWLTGTTVEFTLSVQDFKLDTLAALLQGEKTAAVAGASIVDESVPNVYEGQVLFTAYPGISSVTVKEGAVTLVEGTDYNIVDSGRDGGISIITGAPNISGSGPLTLLVSYTHVGLEGTIKALTQSVSDYQIRFNGINLNAPTKPVIVQINRAQINAAEDLGLIGTEITSLTFTGAVLPDASNEFYTVTKANAVS